MEVTGDDNVFTFVKRSRRQGGKRSTKVRNRSVPIFNCFMLCFVYVYIGCTEKPDTVRYADTARYRTDSRGRLTELARAVRFLYSCI